jgi:nucleoid DNA-binding protein
MKITRADIDRKLSERTALSLEQSGNLTRAVFDAIVQVLSSGEAVSLHGFGRLSLRPKRGAGGHTVAFSGFKRLRDRIDAAGPDDLDKAVWSAPQADKRRESREESAQDGTAIVRISGIPVCEFKIKSISENGTSFWVREDSFILRNLRIGQEIEIRMHNGYFAGAQAPALFRSRIAHITKADFPGMSGYFILGVQILDKLPM